MHKNFIFPSQKNNEPMKISAPYFLYNQEFLECPIPKQKCWVNPKCQNSEPRKKTVSISAYVKLFPARILGLPGKVHARVNCILGFSAYIILS